MIALRRDIGAKEIEARDFERALQVVKPSADEETIKMFENRVGKLEAERKRMDYFG
jgi:SpoVK/Ycf46/Vps4 family AAA+-type ATPase